jgi:hypothetical protein
VEDGPALGITIRKAAKRNRTMENGGRTIGPGGERLLGEEAQQAEVERLVMREGFGLGRCGGWKLWRRALFGLIRGS